MFALVGLIKNGKPEYEECQKDFWKSRCHIRDEVNEKEFHGIYFHRMIKES